MSLAGIFQQPFPGLKLQAGERVERIGPDHGRMA